MPLSSPTKSTHSPSPTSSSSSSRRSRVSPEHTLTRVRENQRRHRARQRDRVADLEKRLEVAESLLAAARVEIEGLRVERDMANAFACWDLSRHFDEGRVLEVGVLGSVGAGGGDDDVLDVISPGYGDADAEQSVPAPLPVPVPVHTGLQTSTVAIAGPPPCCTDTPLPLPSLVPISPSTPQVSASSPECATCKTRPPPSPTERTTLCAQAFVLISQRNTRRLDAELIRLWLGRGYRRAAREGEGCRVENGALEGLLEYISGV